MYPIEIIFFIFLFWILTFNVACNQGESTAFDTKIRLEQTLKSLALERNVIVKEVKKEENKLLIEIELKKPYISHPEQQEVLISYLLKNIEDTTIKINEIDFIYYLDNEKQHNVKLINYTLPKIAKVSEALANQKRLKMIEYCMKNFNAIDPYILDKSIIYANKTIPEKAISLGFFELMSQFSQECQIQQLKERKATETILLTYILGKEFIKKEEYQSVPNLIAGIWEICCLESNIENASKVYFSNSNIDSVCE